MPLPVRWGYPVRGRYLLAALTGNKERSKGLMALRVRATLIRFPTNLLSNPWTASPCNLYQGSDACGALLSSLLFFYLFIAYLVILPFPRNQFSKISAFPIIMRTHEINYLSMRVKIPAKINLVNPWQHLSPYLPVKVSSVRC